MTLSPTFRLKPKAPRQEISIVTVTPEMASRWLEANTHNRSLNSKYAQLLADEMRGGRWQFTHQPIAFDENGVLIDGQHRLTGVVLSGITCDFVVAFGMKPESQLVVDKNKLRSSHESITLADRLGVVTAAQIAVLRSMVAGVGQKPGKMSVTKEEKKLGLHLEAINFAIATSGGSDQVKGLRSGPVRAVLARAWYSIETDVILDFASVVKSGVARREEQLPAGLLRSYLQDVDGTGGGYKVRAERYGKTERALFAFVHGEPISRLYATSKELFPLPEEVSSSPSQPLVATA